MLPLRIHECLPVDLIDADGFTHLNECLELLAVCT